MIWIGLTTLAHARSPSDERGYSGPDYHFIVREGSDNLLKPACGKAPLPSCKEYIDPLVAALKERVKDHVDALYQGKMINLFPSSADDKYLPGVQLQKPLCNLEDRVNQPADKAEENHLKDSCGASACKIVCAIGVDGGVDCKADKISCERERAWTRGAMVQLVWKHFDSVVQGLKENHSIRVSGKCNAPLEVEKENREVIDHLSAGLSRWSKLNEGRRISCKVKAQDDPSKPGAVQAEASDEKGADPQGCYLHAAITAYDRVLSRLGLCEIFMRAHDQWKVERETLGAAINDALALAEAACSAQASDLNAYQSCLNEQYKQKVAKQFKAKMAPYQEAPK